uniref:AAA family ATPase n=1 Tax=Bosea sp. NBC_00436 TaxID=2969620 RepID=A0A9E7ZTL8_9HYPH
MTDPDKPSITARVRPASAYWVAGRDPKPPPVRWLIPGMVPLGGLVTLIGAPGSGKSAIMAALGVAVATSGEWLGIPAAAGVPVFVSYEAATSTRRRLAAALADLGAATPIVSIAPDLTLLDRGAEDDLAELLREVARDCGSPPTLLILDSLQSATRGADENSSKDIGRAFGVLQRLAAAFHLTVILIAHNGKDGGREARGTSFILGDVDAQLFLAPENGGGTIEVVKLRDGEPRKPVFFKLVSQGDDLVKAVAAEGPRHDPTRVSPDQGALLGLLIQAGGAMPVAEWEAAQDAALLTVKERSSKALRQARYGCKRKLLETGRIVIESGTVSVSKASANHDSDAPLSPEENSMMDATSNSVSSVSKRQNLGNSDAESVSEAASESPLYRGGSGVLTLGGSENPSASESRIADGGGSKAAPTSRRSDIAMAIEVLNETSGGMPLDDFTAELTARMIAADLWHPADAESETARTIAQLQSRALVRVSDDLDGQVIELRQQSSAGGFDRRPSPIAAE